MLEPSTVDADIEDSSMTRAGPSMLMLHIADGSFIQDRTFHAETRYHGRSISQKRTIHDNASYHGRSISQTRTIHALGRYRGQFDVNKANLPRKRHISRRVRDSRVEPYTVDADIKDGSMTRAGPSTIMPNIMDGSVSRSEPSTLWA